MLWEESGTTEMASAHTEVAVKYKVPGLYRELLLTHAKLGIPNTGDSEHHPGPACAELEVTGVAKLTLGQ